MLFKNIESSALKIPKFVSEGAASLIKVLLNKDPNNRLGCKNNAEEVKSHPYFKNVDWNLVYNR